MLCKGAEEFNLQLTKEMQKKFDLYEKMLLEWNEKINLTAICEHEDIITKHFLDSLSLLLTDKLKSGAKMIDVGTGAGFPGVAVKIARDDISLCLLDSLNKRITYLKELCMALGIEAECVHMRAEDAGRDENLREKFDIATARAVANMATLSEYCLPFVKIGGYFLALKGPMAHEELENAKKAIKALGGELRDVIEVKIPNTDLRHSIVIIEKVGKTDKAYPRKAPLPQKKPL